MRFSDGRGSWANRSDSARLRSRTAGTTRAGSSTPLRHRLQRPCERKFPLTHPRELTRGGG